MIVINLQTSVGAVMEVGATVSDGDAVYVSPTGKLEKASASSVSTIPAVGFVDNIYGSQGRVEREGIVGGYTGLSIGQAVFLSETPGGVTQTPPVGAGKVVQEVGTAISGSEILIVLDMDATVNS